MRYSVSDTAEHGDYTGGPRIITQETRREMRKMLAEIQDGSYARQWISENDQGRPQFEESRRGERKHALESLGRELRAMMPFLNPATVPETASEREKSHAAEAEALTAVET